MGGQAFEMADTGIGIHTDNKNFALAACAFEIADVSNVQGVKATVGKYDASAWRLCSASFSRRTVRATILEAASRMIYEAAPDASRRMASRVLGAKWWRFRVHDHQASGDVGNVGGLKR